MHENFFMSGDGKQIGGLETGLGVGKDGISRGHRETLEVIHTFILLTVVMVSWEYTWVKSHCALIIHYLYARKRWE